MLVMTIILLITTTILGGIFFVLFRWAVKDGQFDDPEEAKYVIFREEEKPAEGAVDGGNK
ncbi:cbb3-type cytochrome oxidase assembly protein CcoS [Pontiella agarivorans]|uniref:Cbb3-type cytochrome oxidase assembly protein CcoS n=1 Tax=Pontiella agarivorans TaxID=3038953 RepID=A0ABU5MZ26_9BACT|nr:cbb3-type cytochrome oxidase assembly protein CcoS [Pontiella agarivorans]MDZ8119445.1 cbb3-type cytochrome oxidase assembly protein CcoS [Pontiella agarivorans]